MRLAAPAPARTAYRGNCQRNEGASERQGDDSELIGPM